LSCPDEHTFCRCVCFGKNFGGAAKIINSVNINKKGRQSAKFKIERLSQKKNMAQTLADRTAEYVDTTVHCVDIMNCVPGALARGVKPGGTLEIITSIRDDGYKRVQFLRLLNINTFVLTACCSL
jgi:hypothetical protein